MKKELIVLVVLIVFASGCVQRPVWEMPATTTSVAQQTTTVEVAETTTTVVSEAQATTTVVEENTSAVFETTVNAKPDSCETYCESIGYAGGECRRGRQECRQKVDNGVYKIRGNKFCPKNSVYDSCCCIVSDG